MNIVSESGKNSTYLADFDLTAWEDIATTLDLLENDNAETGQMRAYLLYLWMTTAYDETFM